MSFEWKPRGNENEPYQARRISHEAKSSIEYGEKTWTTAQTVRDLMQNHLDAETDKYYKSISSILIDRERGETLGEEASKKIEDFLYSCYMFASHVSDMTPETRSISEKHLQKLSEGLSVRESVVRGGMFDSSLFVEQASEIAMHTPSVSYEITNTETKESLGWIPYETLRDEPLYQKTILGKHTYAINGMKMVDRGPGYDSQLSALYISSKTGKRHLRGKFGEGAKMSELHLLRHGAQMKMRSQYALESDEGEKKRIWQARAKIVDKRLVSEGVEIEKTGDEETGSTTIISLKNAGSTFRDEMVRNIDPRKGGLAGNIAEFGSQDFVYPMPVAEPHLVGINMSGSGDIQYVQGLRVELAEEAFAYSKPWYSYNILDSSIIAGRDRNEIKNEIVNRISAFWKNNDNPELLRQLVHTVVHDKYRGEQRGPTELSFFESTLIETIDASEESQALKAKIQGILDEEFLKGIAPEKNLPTLVLSNGRYKDRGDWGEVILFAEREGYRIKTVAVDVSPWAISKFAGRISAEYKIMSLRDVEDELRRRKEENKGITKEFVEGEKEQAIREVFSSAVDSLNSFLTACEIPTRSFTLRFAPSDDGNLYDEDEYDSHDPFALFSDKKEEKKAMRLIQGELSMDPYEIDDPRGGGEGDLKRQIELCLLSAYKNSGYEKHDTSEFGDSDDGFTDFPPTYFEDEFIGDEGNEDYLKETQHILDSLLAKIMPEDSSVLTVIPHSFDYVQNIEVMKRLLEGFSETTEGKTDKNERIYSMYRKIISSKLSLDEAMELLGRSNGINEYPLNMLSKRVFLRNNSLCSYSSREGKWHEMPLSEENRITMWNGYPVYELEDGRFFVAASMGEGAVFSKGEGKQREYVFNDGENFLRIGENQVGFTGYDTNSDGVSVHPAGFILAKNKNGATYSPATYVQERLKEYSYFPTGSTEKRKDVVIEGVFSTAIPVEYGKDEWDNPVRIFQDIIQNHLDAASGAEGVSLGYQVERDGKIVWVKEEEMGQADVIIGLMISDNGEGYAPSDIDTMGASSKKSPLFAGKYGEGQKMIAAAALRSGLDLEYQSFILEKGERTQWSAHAVSESRDVVLDGKEVEKKLVAFDVSVADPDSSIESRTILKMSSSASPKEAEQWSQWVSIIDPRKKDNYGNSGLARFVRQLREPKSEREYRLGNITILLDEPGAVYENGLRINSQAEAGRSFSFGYDVPEVVTTRERNSYNSERLHRYMHHIIAHIEDPQVIKEILDKVVAGKNRVNPDLKIGDILRGPTTATSAWAKVAQKMWPGYLVYSSEKLRSDMDPTTDEYGNPNYFLNDQDRKRQYELAEKARRIHANMAHIDRKKLLDVSEDNYAAFSSMLPTVEEFVSKLETVTVPMPAETKKILSKIVAESANMISQVLKKKQEGVNPKNFDYTTGKYNERIQNWTDARSIEQSDEGVAVSPISSAFHGKAELDKGVIFNEALLFENNRRQLAAVSLHEMTHIITREGDYTEEFVGMLYDLAKYLVSDVAPSLHSQPLLEKVS
jgi:hypothetical protein